MSTRVPAAPTMRDVIGGMTQLAGAMGAADMRVAGQAASAGAQAARQAQAAAAAQGVGITAQINDMLRTSHMRSLDSVMPGWRNTISKLEGAAASTAKISETFMTNVFPKAAAQVNAVSEQMLSNVSSFLQGEIPQDVADQVARRAAEQGLRTGVRGEAAHYLQARDLGLTSLDMMMTGHELAPAAGSFAGQSFTALQAPAATAAQTSALALDTARSLLPPQTTGEGVIGSLVGAAGSAATQAYGRVGGHAGTSLQGAMTVLGDQYTVRAFNQSAAPNYDAGLGNVAAMPGGASTAWNATPFKPASWYNKPASWYRPA